VEELNCIGQENSQTLILPPRGVFLKQATYSLGPEINVHPASQYKEIFQKKTLTKYIKNVLIFMMYNNDH
jgi:hypothetical protein